MNELTVVLTTAEVANLVGGRLDALLRHAATIGATEVIAEVSSISSELIGSCVRNDLRLLVGVTCFHEHDEITLNNHPDLWPVRADGSLRPRSGWYVGLTPTVPWLQREIVERSLRLAAVPGVSGVVLDFIRWPVHWELECRGDSPRIEACSFDTGTLSAWSAVGGCVGELDGLATAGHILGEHRAQWDSFRCAIVTDLVEEIACGVNALGKSAGAFVVPLSDADRRRIAGQDIAAWGGLDCVYPMTYHSILHQDARWIAAVVTDARTTLAAATAIDVVPVVQLTSDPSYSKGSDWGPQLAVADVAAAVTSAGRLGRRVAVFPGSALIDEELAELPQMLAR